MSKKERNAGSYAGEIVDMTSKVSERWFGGESFQLIGESGEA